MSRIKLMATSVVTVLALVVGSTAYVSADLVNPQGQASKPQVVSPEAAAAPNHNGPCKRMSAANNAGQEVFLSTSEPRKYTGTDWQDITCTNTSFKLQPGQRALVTSDFNAEVDCNGEESSAQWCITRALLNGAEGEPTAPEPSSFAIDSVAGGVNNWQAHSMNRAWEVKCNNTPKQGACRYKFVVQTRAHSDAVTGMWVDDIGVRITVTPGAAAAL